MENENKETYFDRMIKGKKLGRGGYIVPSWKRMPEYNTNITTEIWISILNDRSIANFEIIDVFMKILEVGGEFRLDDLIKKYGKSYSYYHRLISNFGMKIKKKYNFDKYKYDKEYYMISFVGNKRRFEANKRFLDNYYWKIRPELREALMSIDIDLLKNDKKTDIGLNTILYGPPGTGKTYNTVIYAVAIIENEKLDKIQQEEYIDILDRYNTYKEQGLIEFTTFHQSYGYEEFIEGIKPRIANDDTVDENSGDIKYDVESGVFKRFCENAVTPIKKDKNNFNIGNNPNIWKVSLEKTGDNPTRTECMENSHIRIGWDDYGKDITDKTDFTKFGGEIVLNAFINRMKIGDIVLSCYSASTIDAIGVVTGEYEWHDEYKYYKRLRKVEWIVKGIKENILEANGGVTMTLASVYKMSNISLTDVYKIMEKYRNLSRDINLNQNYINTNYLNVNYTKQNYVFIIDEINRGNISKIFGELITLVEPTKRVGEMEGLTVKLPYCKKPFGIPNNIYLIGTMNTADRSIATIDTALRRRFLFKEMLPQPEVLEDVFVDDISISELLIKLNKRISVLYDREHTIGHAYFMPLKDNPNLQTLSDIFKNNIIPLLQEYFYEDYEKIRLVLGDTKKTSPDSQFIIAKINDYIDLFGDVDIDLDDSYSYEINNAAFENIESYRTI